MDIKSRDVKVNRRDETTRYFRTSHISKDVLVAFIAIYER